MTRSRFLGSWCGNVGISECKVLRYVKLSQVIYNDMKSRMNKELWSQKIEGVLDQIGLGYLWTKAHENDIVILNIINQRLKDG